MDDIVLCNKGCEVPRCFKHNPSWQSRVQEIFNKLRDKHIKKVYMNRFNKLLCSCKGLEYANLWEDVTDEDFNLSVKFLDDYVTSNTAGELLPLINNVMLRLRADGELYDIGYGAPGPAPYPRCSALRLCYLLRKVIEKDFEILEPKKPKGVAQAAKKQKEEKSLTLSIDDMEASFIPHLIGEGGKHILIFMKREKCRVEIKQVDEQHVTATITKSILPDDMNKLKEIGEKLNIYVKETKRDYENDKLAAQERMDLEADGNQAVEEASARTGSVTGNVAENSVQTSISSSTAPSATGSSTAPSATGIRTAPSATGSSTALSATGCNIASATTGSSIAPSATGSNTLLTAAGSSIFPSAAGTSITEMAATGIVNHTVDPNNAGNTPDPCPTSCLVHDRRWLSTYQYVLNQCYTHIRLLRTLGSRFSRLVCTCRSDRPEARMYYITEDEMVAGFQRCRQAMMNWPHECQMIIKPLIGQLVKYDKSDIWHSLFKFVFYFHALSTGSNVVLEPDYKLPGHAGSFVPRPEKSYIYQVNFTPNGLPQSTDSGVNSAPGTSSSTARPGTSSLAAASSATGTSSGIGSSLGIGSLLSRTGSAGTTANSTAGTSATNSIAGTSANSTARTSTRRACANKDCRVCAMLATGTTGQTATDTTSKTATGTTGQTVTGTTGQTATGTTGQTATGATNETASGAMKLEKAKLKRVRPEEWSEDCYFHGKKKKSAFQCVVNCLHTKALLPEKLNVTFSLAVCACNETVDSKKYFKDSNDCRAQCRAMKTRLTVWKEATKANVQPFIDTLEQHIRTGEITEGLVKFVYFFNRVVERDLVYLNELHELVKQNRNK